MRDAALKIGVSLGSMVNIRRKAGIRSNLKTKVSKMAPKQIDSAKKNSAKLYKMCVPSGGNFCMIIDDETYMELDPQQAKKNSIFLSFPVMKQVKNIELLRIPSFQRRCWFGRP